MQLSEGSKFFVGFLSKRKTKLFQVASIPVVDSVLSQKGKVPTDALSDMEVILN